jgi:hypothetical protein
LTRNLVRPGRLLASRGMAMCHVCRRSLLAGERFRVWRGNRRERTVCVVCEPRARAAGWLRTVDAYERVRVTGLTQSVRRVA